MNRTAVMLEKMFMIGSKGSHGQKDRIRKAVIGKDQGPPTVRFLWKTHKQYNLIPPTRPVCDASSGPISRTSNILSMISTPIIRNRSYDEHCNSTEDMLRSV